MYLAAKLLQSKEKQLDSMRESSPVCFFLFALIMTFFVLTAQMSALWCVKGLRIELVVTFSFTELVAV